MAQRTLSAFFKKPGTKKEAPAPTQEKPILKEEGDEEKEPSVKKDESPEEKSAAPPKSNNPFFNKPLASKPAPKSEPQSETMSEPKSEPESEPKSEPENEVKVEATTENEESKKRGLESGEGPEPKKSKVTDEPAPNGNTEASTSTSTRPTDALMDDDEDEGSSGEEDGGGGNALKKLSWSGASKEGSTAALNLAKLAKSTKYDPVKDAPFKKGAKVPYSFLCEAFEKISQITTRLDITVILANCFRSIVALTPEDLLPAIYLAINKVAPAHEGIELGVGDALLTKCIADSSGKTEKFVKEMYGQEGDLGLVAQNGRATQKTLIKPVALTVRSVFQTLREIGLASGKDSGKKRSEKIRNMLVASQGTEPQFIIRALQGKMRIGLAEQTVLAALALTLVMTPPNAPESGCEGKSAEKLQHVINEVTERLKMVYSEVPSYDIIIPKLIARGADGLTDSSCSITMGLPVKPMLAKPTKGISEVLDRFTDVDFTCEYKYDGERAQIHYDGKRKPGEQVTIYSRNSENHTTKYPDVIQRLYKGIGEGVTSFILDSEVVAYDTESQTIKPFQVLQHRGRKNIQLEDVKIHVCIFAFDLLYLNGKSLLQEPLVTRRAHLHKSFKVVPTEFLFADYMDGRDAEVIETFLHESIKGNCEGLMVKTLKVDATYQPSKRSLNWLKVKKDYLKGMGDSLDLVPIGGYLGKGKRTGWYGGFLLASYDEESEELQSICKIGTGFSEAFLAKAKEDFKEHIIPAAKPYYRYADDHKPDVWFDDHFVWEVLAADLSISPVHKAAMGHVDPEKGIALRFPRFIRVREDKGPTEATDATQVAEMYRRQFQN